MRHSTPTQLGFPDPDIKEPEMEKIHVCTKEALGTCIPARQPGLIPKFVTRDR